MDPALKPVFSWSDAWLLAATFLAGEARGAVLKDIIAAGDLINRAIFTRQELRRGFGRLIHAGHVRRDGNRFAVAGPLLEGGRAFSGGKPSSFNMLQFFEEALGVSSYPVGDPETEDPQFGLTDLTDEMIARAFELYRKETQAIHQEARDLRK